jgi:hypothetical protein
MAAAKFLAHEFLHESVAAKIQSRSCVDVREIRGLEPSPFISLQVQRSKIMEGRSE